MDVTILYEDDAIVVINKPAGVVVNRAISVKGSTIQDWMESTYSLQRNENVDPILNDEFISRSGVVHRLDKDTSGVLLLAKTVQAFEGSKKQFIERRVVKEYIAVVHGRLQPEQGEIDAPIGRQTWNRERFGVTPEGREAQTEYQTIHIIAVDKKEYACVLVKPKTGRTHQIRVHMTYINHPLLGDSLYAGRKTSRQDAKIVPRIMLHAWKLTLHNPVTALPMTVVAPLPEDIRSFITKNTIVQSFEPTATDLNLL